MFRTLAAKTETGCDVSSQVFPSRVTRTIHLQGLARTRRGEGPGASARLFIVGRVGCIKCPVVLFMLREEAGPGGAEIGFYTLFIVALLDFDKERDSPGSHAT